MKRIYFLISIAMIFLVYGFQLFSSLRDPGEKGGEIKNKSPLFGSLKLDMEEKFLIKESDTEEGYIWGMISDISIDSIGSIYLLDFPSKRILKYDKNGKFIKTIGRVGQGPGEFVQPLNLFIDEKDNLYVNNQGRALIVFDKDGAFKELLRLKVDVSKFYVDEKGYIYTFTREFLESGIIKILAKLDREGNIAKKIAEFVEMDLKVIRAERGGVMGSVKHPYSPDIFFCPVLEGLLCYGENSNYKFSICDFEGNLKLAFSKEEKIQSITSKEKDKFSKQEGVVFPPHRPFFKSILSDEKGRIWVIRVKSILEKDKTENIDIFSKDGRYLYEAELPYLPRIIRDGCIWVIDRDEEDKTAIKKLVIKNYNSMKY